jgi:GxxExxY protein
MERDRERDRIESVATHIVDACLRVHRALCPGMLESTYQTCLTHELRARGLRVDCEVALPICYEDVQIDAAYRIDMMVEDLILIENKSIQTVLPIHHAQLLTYLKLSDRRLGFLINWNVTRIMNGLKRMAYRL